MGSAYIRSKKNKLGKVKLVSAGCKDMPFLSHIKVPLSVRQWESGKETKEMKRWH